MAFSRPTGFTLIELLITVAIVALLASVALPLSEVAVQREKEQDLRRSLREIRGAIDTYKRHVDEGRIKRAADASGYPPSLALLVEGTEDVKSATRARIRFLRRLPATHSGAIPRPQRNRRGDCAVTTARMMRRVRVRMFSTSIRSVPGRD